MSRARLRVWRAGFAFRELYVGLVVFLLHMFEVHEGGAGIGLADFNRFARSGRDFLVQLAEADEMRVIEVLEVQQRGVRAASGANEVIAFGLDRGAVAALRVLEHK